MNGVRITHLSDGDCMIYDNVNEIPIKSIRHISVGYGKKRIVYKWIYSGYDIETTTQYNKNEKGKVEWCFSFPYLQQFSINDNVVLFHSYDELRVLLIRISNELNLDRENRTIIFIHNLSFEFAHMRKYLSDMIESVFARAELKPIKVDLKNGITFLDSMSITNMSLSKLAKTYCKTQKLVGDLDYSKPRHYKTKMSQEELNYCINDVVILSEFSEWYFNNFLLTNHHNRHIPITSTSIVRHELKLRYKSDEKYKQYKEAIRRCYPRNYSEYLELMQLFQGGYVHANCTYTDIQIFNMDSFDLKSSYPAVLLSEYFPMSPFYIDSMFDETRLEEYLNKYCCWFYLTIKNVKNKTSHSIISISKCIKSDNCVIDNGRVLSADMITISVNEIDYKMINDFYNFEIVRIDKMRISKKGKLPKYVREMVAYYYQKKYDISIQINNCKDAQEKIELEKTYALVKAKLNSLYGMMVTKIPTSNIIYSNDCWGSELVKDMEQKIIDEKHKNPLLPQWGVWCTSHARSRVLQMCRKLSSDIENVSSESFKNDCVYIDTDSTKIRNYYSNRWLYDLFNAEIIVKNRSFINELNLEYDVFFNIGTFEFESSGDKHYEEFKTLGSKRYIYKDKKGWHQTIAGLPKTALIDFCKNNNLDVMNYFSDNMMLDDLESTKLCSYYVDEELNVDIDDGVTIENHTIKSCVALVPTTFKLNVIDTYTRLFTAMQKKIEFQQYF